jgi:hypothetical protein
VVGEQEGPREDEVTDEISPSRALAASLPRALTKGNAPTAQIIGRQLNCNTIPLNDLDEELPHLTRRVRQHRLIILELHAKDGIRQHFDDLARDLNRLGSWRGL